MSIPVFYFNLMLFVFLSKSTLAQLVSISPKCVKDFRFAILQAHNRYRLIHGVHPLIENSGIVNASQNYANNLARNNIFTHSYAKNLGENLAQFWSSYRPDINDCASYGENFAKMWYDEIYRYNFNNPGFSMATGHFTQVIWKSTTQIGCGLAINIRNKVYGVCNYYPPGNYLGQFIQNVFFGIPG